MPKVPGPQDHRLPARLAPLRNNKAVPVKAASQVTCPVYKIGIDPSGGMRIYDPPLEPYVPEAEAP